MNLLVSAESTPLINTNVGKLFVKSKCAGPHLSTTYYLCDCACGTKNIVIQEEFLLKKTAECCGCSKRIPSRLSNIRGLHNGRLTAVSYVGQQKGSSLWLYECCCDKKTKIILRRFSTSKDRGCGCSLRESVEKNTKKPGESASNAIFYEYNATAKKRQCEFTLSKERFLYLTQQTCYYCGRPPFRYRKGITGPYNYNGLDRIDNLKGYTEDNVVPCCKDCNGAKTTLTQPAFFNLVQKIYENRLIEHNILIATSGASGQIYVKTLIDYLVRENIKFDFLFSATAETVAQQELNISYRDLLTALNKPIYDVNTFRASSASSSTWKYTSMIVIPASMGMTSRLAKGLSTNLIERSFDVALALRLKTVLVPREGVFTHEHLNDMLSLSTAGTIIAPACPSFYSGQETLNDLVDSVVGKLLSLLGIKNSVRKPWKI